MYRYEVQGRNGYYAIDEYIDDVCLRNVFTGTKKTVLQVKRLLEEALIHGKVDEIMRARS